MATLKPELKAILEEYGIDPRNERACREWPGSKRGGYGIVRRNGRTVQVTRFIFESALEHPLPEGAHVLHRCDNPSCVNILHLFLGTAHDNMRDMTRKGRNVPGRKGQCRLSEVQIAELLDRLARGERQVDLAAEFGISQSYVSKFKANANG